MPAELQVFHELNVETSRIRPLWADLSEPTEPQLRLYEKQL
jgi:hypothetical protein